MNGLMQRRIKVKYLFLPLGAGMMLTWGWAAASQPDLDSALESLRSARRFLIHATPDKSGHRLNAIKLTDDAIAQVQAGIDAH